MAKAFIGAKSFSAYPMNNLRGEQTLRADRVSLAGNK
jgi:hypothetical protein